MFKNISIIILLPDSFKFSPFNPGALEAISVVVSLSFSTFETELSGHSWATLGVWKSNTTDGPLPTPNFSSLSEP